jgi:hypothetical protein
MLRLFDSKSNNENLDQSEGNPFWLLLPISCMGTKILEAPITQHYRQSHANLWLAEIWFTIFPSEQTVIEYKKKSGHYWLIQSKSKEEQESNYLWI